MPDRSKKELEQIHSDLQQIKEALNWLRSFGDLVPIPLNGKSWSEEKDFFYDRALNVFHQLIDSGKVKSCECKTLLGDMIRETDEIKGLKGFWNHIGRNALNSQEMKVEGYSIDQLMNQTEKTIQNQASNSMIDLINNVFDSLGTSACTPRAFNLQNESTWNHGLVDNNKATPTKSIS